MTPEQQAQLNLGETLIDVAVATTGNPNVQMAWSLIRQAQAAIEQAYTDGTDITDAQLAALFVRDDEAKAADAAAQAAKAAASA